MRLILVSGRHLGPATRLERDAKLASDLAAMGCDVRWLCPRGDGRPELAAGDAEVLAVDSTAPGFNAVQDRLLDAASEHALAAAIRSSMADLVHVLDFGGCSSVNASWLATRLGAPTLVSLRAAPTLCHRGDLRHGDGQDCDDWNDPVRCARCCLIPSAAGVGPIGALVGRMLGAIHWPLNPFPTSMDFENRIGLLLGGLQVVDRILVESESDREMVASLGIRPGLLAVQPSMQAADLLPIYRQIVAGD